MSDPGYVSPVKKKANRRTLLLLTRSQGVQTGCPADISEAAGNETGEDSSRAVSDASSALRAVSADSASVQPQESSEPPDVAEETAKGDVLLTLIEHLHRVLMRLRVTDIRTLNRRLKRHNLPGDVSHLSQSTLRSLLAEVSDLRQLTRSSSSNAEVTKREIAALVKLLKEVFGEIIALQSLINDVTINPKLAKKLRLDAFREDDEPTPPPSSSLGWIAAPITKFFVTPASEPDATTSSPLDRGRLQPQAAPPKIAPKQHPTMSATTTHVSVEFGGTGIVRRATPAASASGSNTIHDSLPPSPLSEIPVNRIVSDPLRLSLDAPKQVRRVTSRANREDLQGIFAGARRPVSPSPWVVLPEPVLRIDPELKLDAPSKTVKAILDANEEIKDVVEPLLERTLRPRGLSESSIRTPVVVSDTPFPAMTSAGPNSVPARGGMLGALSRRFYPFGSYDASNPSPPHIDSVAPPDDEAPTPRLISDPAKGSRSRPSTSPGPPKERPGWLGSLASSLVSDVGASGEDELVGAPLWMAGTRIGGGWT